MKALICDDDPIVLKVIQIALQEEGLDTTTARDGDEALPLLDSIPRFDLLVTDIHMPYYNGDIILQAVREKDKTIPIIMISSDADEDVIKMALKLGVSEFLSKPVDPNTLKSKVRKVLNTRK